MTDNPRPNAQESAKMEVSVFLGNVDAERALKEIIANIGVYILVI